MKSILQAVSNITEEAPTPLHSVQMEGLVVLKNIKHCEEFARALVTGQLLGLDVGSVLEVTNCFPFPVLATRVNLPCKLVKGICYTITDEGAVNLVKVDFDSTEYIIVLMGAPGTLILSDISGCQFQDSNNSQLRGDAIEEFCRIMPSS